MAVNVKKKHVIGTFIIMSFIIFMMKYNEVSKTLTEEDKIYIDKILRTDNLDTFNLEFYQNEIALIKLVQKRVLNIAPVNKGIQHSKTREPKDLFTKNYGLCYDRSRTIEKILIQFGFVTRHIAIYKSTKSSLIPGFLNTSSESHALSEVNTSKGWIFVDSNDLFIGLDNHNSPVSIDDLYNKGFNKITWTEYNNLNYNVLYKYNFTYLYGLYSRHGYFYPPYNRFPDLNFNEFSENFF